MTWRKTFTPRLAATGLALALVAVASGCQQDEQSPLANGTPTSGDLLTVRTEVSSLTAKPGDRVAVAIRAEATSAQPLVGLQGTLKFNPQQLRYLGQPEAGPFAIVNEKAVGQGQLRAASLQITGLPSRTATFVFEVTGADYTRGLSYTIEGAARKNLSRFTKFDESKAPVVSEDLAVPAEPKHMDLAAWRTLLAPAWTPGPQLVPGQIVPDLKYGDVTLDGTIDVAGDAFYTANASVGNVDLILDPAAGARDVVIAGNVDPANSPGLGEEGDANPPGREANGSRLISIFDASAIASAGVGIAGPVAGQLIPGRTTGATPDTISYAAGVYTGTLNWTKDHVYKLTGVVRIGGNSPSVTGNDSVGVLNIEAGTQVLGNTASGVTALFIQRNGQIFADGTIFEPIVMTCDAATPFKGCWGGLFIAGNASTNTAAAALGTSVAGIRNAGAGCLQNQGEGGAPVYGGCDPADNSGVLRYLRVEYAGFLLSPNNELNGITLSSVGSGTTVEYIQVHAGLDDGIETFGGSVNMRYIYLTANSDDSFDNDFGYNGSIQFVIAQHDSLDADKGTEVDNSATAAAYNNTPRTAFTLYNFTFYGKASPAGTGGPAANNSEGGFNIRKGARPTYANGVVMKFLWVLDLDDAETCVNLNTDFKMTNTVFAGNDSLGTADTDPTCAAYPVATNPTVGTQLEAIFLQDPLNLNTVVTSPAGVSGVLARPYDVSLPDFRPLAGSPALSGAAAAPAGNTFIQSVTYRGAVDPNAVPWYSGWTRGWRTSTAP
jgi:hypothetical protein